MYKGWPTGLPLYVLGCSCYRIDYMINIRLVPTFILENWMAANRVKGSTRFYYPGITFTIQEVREELAKRRENEH